MIKVFVNDDCIGCGACVALSPDYFEFNDDGLAEAKERVVAQEFKEELTTSASHCPTDAIIVEET